MRKLTALLALGLLLACENDSNDFVPDLSGTGTGGSLAKFTIVGDHLLVLNDSQVRQYDINSNGALTFRKSVFVGSDLETIFPYGSNVLIGSASAVHFLGFDGDGLITYISEYSHLTACDPVVASNGLAFTTLKVSDCRSGTDDFIEAIDISNINSPNVLRVYDTRSPFGLAIKGQFLFVCEKGGMTMYNFNGQGELTEMDFMEIPSAIPLDIIVNQSYLIVRTDRGIYNVAFGDTAFGQVLGSVTTE